MNLFAQILTVSSRMAGLGSVLVTISVLTSQPESADTVLQIRIYNLREHVYCIIFYSSFHQTYNLTNEPPLKFSIFEKKSYI